MLQLTFQKDGKLQVFAMQDGDVISVTTDANRIPSMLPDATGEILRDAVADLHATLTTAMPRKLKIAHAKVV
jgi:hypothetical protein